MWRGGGWWREPPPWDLARAGGGGASHHLGMRPVVVAQAWPGPSRRGGRWEFDGPGHQGEVGVGNLMARAIKARWALGILMARAIKARWALGILMARAIKARWALGILMARAIKARWALGILMARAIKARWALGILMARAWPRPSSRAEAFQIRPRTPFLPGPLARQGQGPPSGPTPLPLCL